MIPHSVSIYLVIGFIITAMMDFSIRQLKSSKPFTLLEIVGCILVWPIMVIVIIKQFLDGEY